MVSRASVVVALVIALCGAARAEDRVLAERLFRAGEKAYKAQNFGAAAASFEEAYKALPLPQIAFSAAQAHRRQYRIDKSAAHVARAIAMYRAYLDKIQTGGRVADATDALAEMQRELDALIKSGAKVSPELAAEHTQLGVIVTLGAEAAATMREVEDAPTAATTPIVITIDGTNVAPATPLNVAPGTHAVHVEAEGFAAVDRQEQVPQGSYQMIDIALVPKPAIVAVHTEEGARVSLDGRPLGSAPINQLELPAGKHLLAILRDGREPFARELVVGRGQRLVVDEPLVVTWRRRAVKRVAIVGAATLAAFAAATVFEIVEDGRANDLHRGFVDQGNRPLSERTTYNDAIAVRDGAQAAMWVTGGVTLTLGVAAALLYYTDQPSLEGVHVEAVASPTAGGAVVSGHF